MCRKLMLIVDIHKLSFIFSDILQVNTKCVVTVRQVYLYLCGYGWSLLHAVHYSTLQPSFSGKPFPILHLSVVPLRLPELCLQVPSLLAFQQLLFLNASQKLLFAQRAWRDEKSDKEREKRKWMGNRGVREGKEDRGIYQDGRIEIEKQRL